jgi:FAD/FMN-containing dehydrogenase
VHAVHQVHPLNWRDENVPFQKFKSKVLPFGSGRSYGDSCLNDGGVLLATENLNRMISFNPATGVIRCEAGVTLAEILDFALPHGFFIPITLGTKLVTVGGAIANDVHGKNHHRAGTFGCHVLRFEILRSDGFRDVCSPLQNRDLYAATIGGLGLTGLITWAEIQLRKVSGPKVDVEMIRFEDLDEYFGLVEESDRDYEHTSAWADYLTDGNFGKGIFLRGNFNNSSQTETRSPRPKNVPFFFPNWCLNDVDMKLFNTMYLYRMASKSIRQTIHYDSFFFPLDVVGCWSRLYGKRGFFQYQFVIPTPAVREGMKEILNRTLKSSVRPYLTVLKTFASKKSPGLLSFPIEGLTVALDFPNQGAPTRALFDEFDRIVASHEGRVYPAKDARMSADSFSKFFPHWRELIPHIDPKFSSSFWRRVTGEMHA